MQDLGEEATVKQMQDRMRDATDILINRHPGLYSFKVERHIVASIARVAQEVPR